MQDKFVIFTGTVTGSYINILWNSVMDQEKNLFSPYSMAVSHSHGSSPSGSRSSLWNLNLDTF